MGVRIQELPETTGINKEDVLIVEDGQGTKKGTVQQLDEALGVSQLKEDIANSKKAIVELADKKITKFYANSLGETTLNDSDNGKIQDMILYGKSSQDGTPTSENPVEIKSVVNPKLRIVGGTKGALLSEAQYNILTTTLNSYLNDRKEIYYIPDNNIGFNKCVVILLNNTKFESIDSTGVYNKYDSSQDWIHIFKNLGTLLCSSTVDPKETIGYGIEPQTASLPYTLNAIPVSSGGNVTIDGQQYIADYVDIEKKKLVRNVGIADLGTLNPEHVTAWGIEEGAFRYSSLEKNLPPNFSKKNKVITESYKLVGNISSWSLIIGKGDNVIGTVSVGDEYGFIIRDSSFTDANSFKQAMTGSMICYELATPTITDLTDEEVQAFKDLMAYYSTTNVIVTSDQLDGFTTFNYPLSMANGWNLIKEQLGDTREYIYDMELQSAEAYVNSEYAVTLTELGV